jgi:hypothetical protein
VLAAPSSSSSGITYYLFGYLNAFLLSAYAEMSAAIIGILMPSYPAAVVC